MKILILTQYFPPEIGAPQNRLFELAVRLQKQGIDITVLTAMPNYPTMEIHEAYQGLKYHYEEMNGLKVHRSSIYVTKSKSITKRLRNYFSFVWSSYKIGKRKLDKQYNIIFCESPPLFLGISAYYLSKEKKAKMIFNVSDLWPESAEKLGIVTNKLFLGLATRLEEFLYKKSVIITGQTQGIVENISKRFPNKKVYWLPNGVDLSYYNPATLNASTWRQDNGFSKQDRLFFYGGIIGHAQGLEIILTTANELKKQENIHFILMGSGPEKESLIEFRKEMDLKNVHFFEPVTKQEMPNVVGAINASIIPLRKLDLFLGAIPSKIFENLAMEKPIILGVDGEAKQLFIEEGNCGLFFEPENHLQLAEKIKEYVANPHLENELGQNGRQYVDKKFNRNTIANNFIKTLKELPIN